MSSTTKKDGPGLTGENVPPPSIEEQRQELGRLVGELLAQSWLEANKPVEVPGATSETTGKEAKSRRRTED